MIQVLLAINGVLLILTVFFALTTFKLLKGLETLEDLYNNQADYIVNLHNNLLEIHHNMQTIDRKKIFESEDEVGAIFKGLQEQINLIRVIINK